MSAKSPAASHYLRQRLGGQTKVEGAQSSTYMHTWRLTIFSILSSQVALPAADGHTFKFAKRIASHSFDPALRATPQSFRSSTSRASFHDPPAKKTLEVVAIVEPETAEIRMTERTRTEWI